MNSFVNDLKRGIVVENIVLQYIQTKYPSACIVNAFKGYDIWIPELHKSVEVKYDLMSNETGNMIIEIGFNNKPSALFTTTADIWVFYDDNVMAFITPTKLLQFLLTHKYSWLEFTATGDNKIKRAYLVAKNLLFNHCKVINTTKSLVD